MGSMIAFYLPEASAQALYDQAVAADLTPTPREQMHVTLCYLGETDAIKPFRDNIDRELTQLVQWIGAVEGTINGAGRFSGEEEDVFYASVDAPLLNSVQRAVYSAMRWSDVPVAQTHGFQPHITLSALATDADTPNLRVDPIPVRFGEIVFTMDEERITYTLGVQEGVVQEEVDKHLMNLREKATKPLIGAAEMASAAEIVAETTNHPRILMAEAVSDEQDARGRTRIQLTFVTEIAGEYPNIPLPEDVDTASDNFFVTLPIGMIDARSRNQRNYRAQSMTDLRDQVNAYRPEGMWGHLKDEDFGTKYGPPAIRWLASLIDDRGIVWGKGRPQTAEAVNYYRMAKLDNARVGTSIFAWAEMEGDDVIGLDLITIDLADPARVGVPMTAARPLITAEMQADAARSQTPTIVHSTQEGKEMPTELEQAQARIEVLQEQIRTLTLSQQAQTRQIADYNRVAELLGKPEDVILGVRAVMQQRDDLKRENAELLEETVKAKVAEKVKIESARPIIIEQVMARKPATRTDVATAIDTVMDMGSVKELLKYGLQTEMGDPQPKHTEGKSQSQPSSGVMYIPGA
jgi:2'-5' RNA ligase